MIQRKKMNPIAVICINAVVLVLLYFLISLFFGGRPDWWNAIIWDKPMTGGDLGAFFLMVVALNCAIYILYGFIRLLRFGPRGESVTKPASQTVTVPQSTAPAYIRRRRGSVFGSILALILGAATLIAVPALTTIGAIYSQLQSESVVARISAVDKLAEYGSGGLTRPLIGKRATNLLSDALLDEESSVRIAAAEGLGRIGDTDAVDPLAVALQDENADVVFAALIALQSIDTDDAVTAIVSALDGDAALRQMSLCILSEIDNDIAQQALVNAPDASPYTVKMKELAVAALSNAFQDSGSDGQKRIIDTLKNIGTSDATEALSALLKTDNEEIRLAIADALIVIGNDSAVAALADALQTGSVTLQGEAAEALKTIDSSSATDALITALQSKKEDTQRSAALALSGIDNSEAKEALNALIEQKNLSVIAQIYDYYIKAGITGSEPIMIEALNQFGYSTMAEAFLNCGNSTLEDAATDWADRHGYDIIQSSWAGAYSHWGSD